MPTVYDGTANALPYVISGGASLGAKTAADAYVNTNGSAIFTKAVVKTFATWPDYVFDPAYRLMPIDSLSGYLSQYKHLPDMPSAEEIKKNGQDLGEMNQQLLKKVEELTLYIMAQDKARKELEERAKRLEADR